MKYSEIAEMATDEIQERLAVERDKLIKMKINHTIAPIENPRTLGMSRKVIARMLTELNKRKKNEAANTEG